MDSFSLGDKAPSSGIYKMSCGCHVEKSRGDSFLPCTVHPNNEFTSSLMLMLAA